MRAAFSSIPILIAVAANVPGDDGLRVDAHGVGEVRVAGIALKWIRGDKEANWRRVEPMIREAAKRGAQVVCTTECFLDGYSIADKSIPLDRYRTLGEPVPDGSFFRRLRSLADELDIYLVAGFLEAEGEARYNTAVLLGPDGTLAGKYHKQKLGHESSRNTAGSESPVFGTPWGKLGVMICADRREPGIARKFCASGAAFVLCPSGGMYGPARNDPIVQARSRENGVPIVFVHPAEFLVTARDGSILRREIVGDRLLIAAEEEAGPRDRNAVFTVDLQLSPEPEGSRQSAGRLDLSAVLARRILPDKLSLQEVQAFLHTRIARMPDAIQNPREWAEGLREDVLDAAVFKGEAMFWRRGPTAAEWLDPPLKGNGYSIRKLRYQAVPGLWIPALLYTPEKLEGKVPVILNVNGHDGKGKAAPYKQIRSIEQATRGALALNVEWLGMGQLRDRGYSHTRMNQLDLCGTSGLAPYYLSMKRGLDVLLSLEHADPKRVAVAGLSGGGWQTIVISSLDPRVTLANPVAGYGSYLERIEHFEDLGDSEQTPVDLAAIADYTHLTALLAPRPALLTYNAQDNCCFRAGHTLPRLLSAAEPVYELHGQPWNLRTHVNHTPGDHNFGEDNRRALYSMLVDHFGLGESDEETASEAEVRGAEELHVALPEGNATFHTLAVDLAAKLPKEGQLPTSKAGEEKWRSERLRRLRRVVRATNDHSVVGEQVASARFLGGEVAVWWKLRLGKEWTVPAVEIARGTPEETVVLVADGGRRSASTAFKDNLEAGRRVVAIDPFYLGESAIPERPYLFALLVSSVRERPLGIQVAQIAAVARWFAGVYEQRIRVESIGARSSLAALAAGALEPKISSLTLRGSLGSLHEVIERDLSIDQAPELFCFGLLEHFDIRQLAALMAERELGFPDASERVREELEDLAQWFDRHGGRLSMDEE